MDPLAEKYYFESPYMYVGGNPIIFIDPDGRKKVRGEIGGALTTGIAALSIAFWDTPIGGSYDFGSTSKGGTIFVEYNDDNGEFRIGVSTAEENGKEGSYSFGLGFWGYKKEEKKTVGGESSVVEDGRDLKVEKKVIVEESEEEGGSIGPVSVSEKETNGKETVDTTIDVGEDINVGIGVFGIKFKAKVTITESEDASK